MFTWLTKDKIAYNFIPHDTMTVEEYNAHVERNKQKAEERAKEKARGER